MKRTFIKLFIATFAIVIVASCSHRLVGTWQVTKYEISSPGEQGTSLSNIGTITFTGKGNGEKNLNYIVLGIQREDNVPFQWIWTDGKYVTIDSKDSDFSKTWIIMENKSKSQKWKSTDGSNVIQTLEMTKE